MFTDNKISEQCILFFLLWELFWEFTNGIQGYVMPDHVPEFSCHLGTEYNGNCRNCLIFADSAEGYSRSKKSEVFRYRASFCVSLESSSSILHTALVRSN